MSEELKYGTAGGSSLELLDALGIGPIWIRRELAAEEPSAVVAPAPTVALAAGPEGDASGASAVVPAVVPAVAPVGNAFDASPERSLAASSATSVTPVRPTPVVSLLPSASARQDIPVEENGPPSWLDEMDFAASADPILIPGGDDEHDTEPVVDPMVAKIAAMDWPQLKELVADCRRCGLCNGRKKTVFGVGDEKAKWLFIGEGPGRNEDMQGEPFVGAAGKLLDNMLAAMGLKRGENAYIANIVKCRPTDDNGRDRPPSPHEVASCLPYLQRQIALIQPTVLVALGKTAAISLLAMDPSTPVSRLRGTVHRYQELPLIVTYHPAYLLRTLGDKSKAWADLCLAMATYQQRSPH